jgi:hypothetical protein
MIVSWCRAILTQVNIDQYLAQEGVFQEAGPAWGHLLDSGQGGDKGKKETFSSDGKRLKKRSERSSKNTRKGLEERSQTERLASLETLAASMTVGSDPKP